MGAALCLALAAVSARAADRAAVITLLEGPATVLAGAQAWQAATGLKLPEASLVDTTANTTLLRLEWPDGSTLDVAPATRLMVSPPAAGLAAPAFYLLQGLVKFSSPAGGHGWRAPRLEQADNRGTVVVLVEPTQTVVFAESGTPTLTERAARKPRSLKAGEQLSVADGRGAEQAGRPSAELLGRLPRAFRDSLPPRLAAVKPRTTPPEAAPVPRYADLQPWLTAEPALRQLFPHRLAARLGEPEFRKAVQANLRLHPEWTPLLAPPAQASKPYARGEAR